MDHEYSGMVLATFLLQIVTINNLRGRGIFTDAQVIDMFDEALQSLEEQQAVSGAHSDTIASARRLIERQIERERAYPPRATN